MKDAIRYAEMHTGQKGTRLGFTQEDVGEHVVNTLYYRTETPPPERYQAIRMTVFVDGKARMGEIL